MEGKVAIVTASTQGIGFGIIERFGLEGASVVVSSRKQVSPCPSFFRVISSSEFEIKGSKLKIFWMFLVSDLCI